MSTSNASARSGARAAWTLILAASAIMMITFGARQSMGLFVSPLNSSTGLGIVTISFALAVGQFVWGASQPIFGAIADKYGPQRVIMAGGLMLAAGSAITPFVKSDWQLVLVMGVLTAAGAGAGSLSILLGASAQQLPPERRSFAAGFINAGGSFGQFVFAPVLQAIIAGFGWISAMFALAAASIATIPIAKLLTGGAALATGPGQVPAAGPGLGQQLRIAARDPSYWCLHAGFFTCGFHVAFLVTHLPGEVQLCGLPAAVSAASLALIGLFNIAGSISVGIAAQRHRMKLLLFAMYAARALLIVAYLAVPKTAMTFYLFAAGLGFTFLATVPPTAGLVAKLFGVRYMATLFGLTLLTHQIGGFFGAWLGGIALVSLGNYEWMWLADIALAALAAVVNLPIREERVRPALATA